MPDPPRSVSVACGLLLLALACAGSFLPRVAQAQVYQTRSGYAEFTSEVPLHSFRGTSEHLVGRVDLSDGTVDFYLDLATLDTGIGKRDKDLRRTLDTDEHPFAEFFGQIVSDYDPDSRDLQPVQVRGDFTIHGVTREITVEGSIQRTPTSLKVLAGWTLNLEDYDIEPPSLVIVKVDPEQDVFIDAVLEPLDDSNGD